jgi:hypothetical protein
MNRYKTFLGRERLAEILVTHLTFYPQRSSKNFLAYFRVRAAPR